MINLFVLIKNNNEMELQRIPLRANVQQEINDAFIDQSINMLAEKEEIPYSGDYKASPDEVYSIDNYQLPNQMTDALNNALDAEIFDINNYEGKIAAIVSKSDDAENNFIGFQCFDTRKVINRGLSLWFSNDVYGRYNEKGISIPTKMDVLFKENKIHFQSFFLANRILNLGEFMEIASQEDVDTFVENEVFEFEDAVGFRDDLSATIKKKLRLIVQSGLIETIDSNTIYQRAIEMDVEFELNEAGDKLKIPRDKSKVKELIQLLNEDYFISILSETKYVTNSKRKK